jgi:hypothetical protein
MHLGVHHTCHVPLAAGPISHGYGEVSLVDRVVAICVALHPIDQCSNNSGCSDLTEVLEILKVPHQRLILLVIRFD